MSCTLISRFVTIIKIIIIHVIEEENYKTEDSCDTILQRKMNKEQELLNKLLL